MIRVLVVEDSATARRYLRNLFSASRYFEVVGEAGSGAEAVELVPKVRPDIVSLDVFMPGHDASEVVRDILARRSVPIVLVSDAPRDAAEVFDALAAGALDFARKPRPSEPATEQSLLRLMQLLSRVKVGSARDAPEATGVRLVAVASSAGGPVALRDLVGSLPRDFPIPVIVAQHLAAGLEGGLTEWLGRVTSLSVRVARNGQALEAEQVLLCPAGRDILIAPGGRVFVRPAEPRGYHPSADRLFESAAEVVGAGVLAVVLSGIGRDGARGAERVVAAGGVVLAQDRRSSAVYGMPAAVADIAALVAPPAELARSIVEIVSKRGAGAGWTPNPGTRRSSD